MIRELRVKVQNDGFRVDELILVTTMLDPEVDTKEELASFSFNVGTLNWICVRSRV